MLLPLLLMSGLLAVKAADTNSGDRMLAVLAFGAAGFFLAVTLLIGFWVSRRKFNRTNRAGVQEFRDYTAAFKAGFLERLGKLVMQLCVGLSLIFTLLGVFFVMKD